MKVTASFIVASLALAAGSLALPVAPPSQEGFATTLHGRGPLPALLNKEQHSGRHQARQLDGVGLASLASTLSAAPVVGSTVLPLIQMGPQAIPQSVVSNMPASAQQAASIPLAAAAPIVGQASPIALQPLGIASQSSANPLEIGPNAMPVQMPVYAILSEQLPPPAASALGETQTALASSPAGAVSSVPLGVASNAQGMAANSPLGSMISQSQSVPAIAQGLPASAAGAVMGSPAGMASSLVPAGSNLPAGLAIPSSPIPQSATGSSPVVPVAVIPAAAADAVADTTGALNPQLVAALPAANALKMPTDPLSSAQDAASYGPAAALVPMLQGQAPNSLINPASVSQSAAPIITSGLAATLPASAGDLPVAPAAILQNSPEAAVPNVANVASTLPVNPTAWASRVQPTVPAIPINVARVGADNNNKAASLPLAAADLPVSVPVPSAFASSLVPSSMSAPVAVPLNATDGLLSTAASAIDGSPYARVTPMAQPDPKAAALASDAAAQGPGADALQYVAPPLSAPSLNAGPILAVGAELASASSGVSPRFDSIHLFPTSTQSSSILSTSGVTQSMPTAAKLRKALVKRSVTTMSSSVSSSDSIASIASTAAAAPIASDVSAVAGNGEDSNDTLYDEDDETVADNEE